jgi:hypothetical protein
MLIGCNVFQIMMVILLLLLSSIMSQLDDLILVPWRILCALQNPFQDVFSMKYISVLGLIQIWMKKSWQNALVWVGLYCTMVHQVKMYQGQLYKCSETSIADRHNNQLDTWCSSTMTNDMSDCTTEWGWLGIHPNSIHFITIDSFCHHSLDDPNNNGHKLCFKLILASTFLGWT